MNEPLVTRWHALGVLHAAMWWQFWPFDEAEFIEVVW